MASVILSSGRTDGSDGIPSSIGMMISSTESFFMEGLSVQKALFRTRRYGVIRKTYTKG
jgi:hypothetical protein